MKDTRFIELVNLYVDRQISPAETAELEADIQGNPRHRKIYQQYCHMHCATKLVYESFRANAEQPAGEASRQRGGSVAQFEHSRQRSHRARWYYSIGGLAAAACFTVVVMRLSTTSPGDAMAGKATSQPVVATLAPSAPIASPAVPAALPVSVSAVALTEQQTAAQLSAKRQEEMRAYALSQQRATQPISLFADTEFDGAQVLASGGQKVFQLKRKTDNRTPTVEAAFQFQR
jgi:anti-sigma factor RsiW